MSRNIISFVLALISMVCFSYVTDSYEFKATLRVPRIYDNYYSLGYRRYQSQSIRGVVDVRYSDGEILPEISFRDFYNKTHKVGGVSVRYDVVVNDEKSYHRLNYIGDNKSGKFKTPTFNAFIEAYPSYAIGEPKEDNSLYLMLSGMGVSKVVGNYRVARTIKGKVSGTIGCSCSDYGHLSPTRVAGPCGASEYVDDVSSVFGTFTMRLIGNGGNRNIALICR